MHAHAAHRRACGVVQRPLEVIVVEAIAKNAMGKVNKKALPESVAELKEVEARFQRE